MSILKRNVEARLRLESAHKRAAATSGLQRGDKPKQNERGHREGSSPQQDEEEQQRKKDVGESSCAVITGAKRGLIEGLWADIKMI